MIWTDPSATPEQRRHLVQMLGIDWTKPEPIGPSLKWLAAQREYNAAIEAAKKPKAKRRKGAA